jgi:hypothetical protein
MRGDGFVRRKALSAVLTAVARAARRGNGVALHVEAQRILQEHPDCELTFAEIKVQIARQAKDYRVGIRDAAADE